MSNRLRMPEFDPDDPQPHFSPYSEKAEVAVWTIAVCAMATLIGIGAAALSGGWLPFLR